MSGGPEFPGLMGSGRMFAKGKRERARERGLLVFICAGAEQSLSRDMDLLAKRRGTETQQEFPFPSLLSSSHSNCRSLCSSFAALTGYSNTKRLLRCIQTQASICNCIFDTGIIIPLHRAQAKLRTGSNPGQNSCHTGGC